MAARRRQASARRGNDPPGGAQRSVHRITRPFVPFGQNVIASEAAGAAAAAAPAVELVPTAVAAARGKPPNTKRSRIRSKLTCVK